ncbi:MAG: exodeoxyribonuclease VII small subunit [Spirochaetaceae bacterium]|nr:exodeoxyribonuclease VII small subunit [Spirochaetaceae bacterium]
MKFEDNLKRMEEIAALLRDNNTSLEESLALFEEGMKLSKKLESGLEDAKRKIEIVKMKNDNDDEIEIEEMLDPVDK